MSILYFNRVPEIIFTILHYIKSVVSCVCCSYLLQHLNEIKDIQISTDKVIIYHNQLLEQSKPGQHLEVMKFVKFKVDKKLWFVSVISDYLQRTEHLRSGGGELLIFSIKPQHRSVKGHKREMDMKNHEQSQDRQYVKTP